ncbi:MAG: phosphate ABC transporter substrate-binding protein [Magnetococcus sp. YQC-5]
MKIIHSLSGILLIMLQIASPAPLLAAEEPLLVAGSTTLLRIVSQAAKDFTAHYHTWNQAHPALPNEPIVILTSGGGSGFGAEAAINGAVHLGMVSRQLKEKEKKALGEHQTFLVGYDAVAIAVNQNNPLAKIKKDLTQQELASLFSGEQRTYKELDPSLPDHEVELFGREPDAGSTETLQETILKEKKMAEHLRQFASQQSLFRKLAHEKWAIGYLSASFAIQNKQLHVFSLDGAPMTQEAIIQGRYPLMRPLQIVVKGGATPKARQFIDYVLSTGQTIVKNLNYIPAQHKNQR